jgi:CRISPR/Cas system-associated endonuclease Cas1
MAGEPIEQCKAAIVHMLEANNRPFNGTNLVDDVAESFKKTLVVKALAALTEEKAITVKLFGKVKICKCLPEASDSKRVN